MELTREIYWNVGHGVATLLPMYLLTLAAIGLTVYLSVQRIKVYRQGQSLERSNELPRRVVAMIKSGVLQSRVLRVRGPGVAHGLFFWSFCLLFLGTCLIVVQADFTDLLFDVRFLTGNFYLVFSLVLDIAGLTAIVMLSGLFIRRYVVRPAGLEIRRDDAIMHGLLFAILISGFIIEGTRMAVTELGTPLASWSPVGLLVAKAFSGLGEPVLRILHLTIWWFHLLLTMAFLVAIPLTKLRHMVTTSLNALFVDLGPTGKLATIDLENEEVESFGADKVADLTWKDLFDSDACTLCKRCQDRCPAYNTDKPLSPMTLVNRIGEIAFKTPEISLIEACDKDAIWSCTTCRACEEICPAAVEHVSKIVDMRRNLVLMEGEFPGEEVMTAMEQTEVNGNPLGMGYAARGDWSEDLGIKTLAEDAEVDILYFVGCYASFDKRNINIAKAFVQLCQAAGVRVGILGKEEKCCGEPMRKMGNEYLYQTLAMENIERIKDYNVAEIVTSCPHCFNTLNKDYRDLGLDIPVSHYTSYLDRLLQSQRLKLKTGALVCTYHDSCYLGRHNGIYDAPRRLIKAVGGQILEMEKSRSEAFCCSAGGGRILAEEKLGSRINHRRVEMAAESGSDTLISNCPFCLTMFEDGVKGAGLEGRIISKDIAEVLVEQL
ncbi:heterodisulfide reductase-related iron-sulfur binding cluster [uncultured Desulfuromusa sp.]|uniref:heterodisulfide reductase-related iron-sulfur binding cluster n=1 Tax=uncultured Desulfuromusa sp. TaxID=219183 RepID=UPI002AA921AB|nr:heterodisulfide reductase-related iron-sulfur binding cluster [uncultured Desulfuromusa sp.]